MSILNNDDLATELRLHPEPIGDLRENDGWLHVGAVTLSKKHPTFSVGFAHPVVPATRFELEAFDVGGMRGWALILVSGGKPAEYFAGWVPETEEDKARRWIARLNDELRKRLEQAV